MTFNLFIVFHLALVFIVKIYFYSVKFNIQQSTTISEKNQRQFHENNVHQFH